MALPPSDSAVAYVSPTYLRTPIREYLVANDKGVYWLRAPRDAGKTQLARGVIERRPSAKDPAVLEGIDSNLASDIRAIRFCISKDHKEGPRQLVDALSSGSGGALGLSEEEKGRVAPSIRYNDPAGARADFVAWLKQLHEAVVAKGGKRLLVCIDGLDAVAEPESGAFAETCSILDLLPPTSDLPPGVLLLVTSRPAAHCPPGLFERITEKFGNSAGFMAARHHPQRQGVRRAHQQVLQGEAARLVPGTLRELLERPAGAEGEVREGRARPAADGRSGLPRRA